MGQFQSLWLQHAKNLTDDVNNDDDDVANINKHPDT
jgi:hypothetical protein